MKFTFMDRKIVDARNPRPVMEEHLDRNAVAMRKLRKQAGQASLGVELSIFPKATDGDAGEQLRKAGDPESLRRCIRHPQLQVGKSVASAGQHLAPPCEQHHTVEHVEIVQWSNVLVQ